MTVNQPHQLSVVVCQCQHNTPLLRSIRAQLQRGNRAHCNSVDWLMVWWLCFQLGIGPTAHSVGSQGHLGQHKEIPKYEEYSSNSRRKIQHSCVGAGCGVHQRPRWLWAENQNGPKSGTIRARGGHGIKICSVHAAEIITAHRSKCGAIGRDYLCDDKPVDASHVHVISGQPDEGTFHRQGY